MHTKKYKKCRHAARVSRQAMLSANDLMTCVPGERNEKGMDAKRVYAPALRPGGSQRPNPPSVRLRFQRIGLDAPVAQCDDAFGEGCQLRIVRHQDQGADEIAIETEHQIDHLPAGAPARQQRGQARYIAPDSPSIS